MPSFAILSATFDSIALGREADVLKKLGLRALFDELVGQARSASQA